MGLPMWPAGGNRNAAGTNSVPPWPFAETRPGTEINLREEMKLMLEGNEYYPRRGHWVLLRRMDRKQRCFCWNEKPHGSSGYNEDGGKYNEAKLRCPICNGEGWVYEDEIQLARRRLVTPEIGLAGSEQMADIGWMNINYIVFYLQYFVNPRVGDKIIELVNRTSGKNGRIKNEPKVSPSSCDNSSPGTKTIPCRYGSVEEGL